MADSDEIYTFDTDDEDGGEGEDITEKDMLETLKLIKQDTSIMAKQAQEKSEQTPLDKSLQTQNQTKSELEATDRFDNDNQEDTTTGAGADTGADKRHRQILEALSIINYSILGLGSAMAYERRGSTQERADENSRQIEGRKTIEGEGKTVKDEDGGQSVKNKAQAEDKDTGAYTGPTEKDQAEDKNTDGKKQGKTVKNKGSKQQPIRPSQNQFTHNAGTQFADQLHQNAHERLNTFYQWYTRDMSEDEIRQAVQNPSSAGDSVLRATVGLSAFIDRIAPIVGEIGAVVGVAGQAAKWGRDMGRDMINQGVGLGGAIGNTTSDAAEDIAHKLGFTANTGSDLQKYRQEALSSNWALYSGKADTYFDTRKWATNEGLTTQADTNWIQEMTALGLSTSQIKNQFEDLSKVSKEVGVSFKNLSQSVAQEATESEKLLGKQNSEGVEKGEVQAQEADNEYGLNSGAIKKMALTSSGQAAMARILEATGHEGQLESSGGDPSLMYIDISKDNLAPALAKNMMATAYQTAIGTTYSSNEKTNKADQEQAFIRNLYAYYGITASDFKNSGMTAFKAMGDGSLPTDSTFAGSLTSNSADTKALPTIKTDIQIGLSKGMEAKIAKTNGTAKGLYSTEGTDTYYHIENKWD